MLPFYSIHKTSVAMIVSHASYMFFIQTFSIAKINLSNNLLKGTIPTEMRTLISASEFYNDIVFSIKAIKFFLVLSDPNIKCSSV